MWKANGTVYMQSMERVDQPTNNQPTFYHDSYVMDSQPTLQWDDNSDVMDHGGVTFMKEWHPKFLVFLS